MQFVAEHAVAVYIIKDWKTCEDPDENVMCLLDNRSRGDFVQLRVSDIKCRVDAGKTILSLF